MRIIVVNCLLVEVRFIAGDIPAPKIGRFKRLIEVIVAIRYGRYCIYPNFKFSQLFIR